jgi:putative PIN family toxin of toxin-antitoxin system
VLRVTADSNVIISALNFNGNPRDVMNLAADGRIRLFISDEILDEVERVLARPKFAWPDAEIKRMLVQISYFTEHVQPRQKLDVIKEDPTDNRILECAMASGSEYLVTGDKHLLKLGKYAGVKIISPADFLKIQERQGKSR